MGQQRNSLPKGWKEEKLGDICIINPSKAEVKNLDENFEVSFIPMAYVSEDGKIISIDKRHLKEVNKGFTFFKNGDVLLAKITPCFENGKKAIAEDLTNGIGFGTTEFYVLRPQEKVISKWLYYNVSREDFRALAKRSMVGAVGQQRVSKIMIENFEVPIISIPEQELIISEIETQFTRLDEAVKSLKSVKEKLEVYRKAVLNKSFRGEGRTLSQIASSDKHSIKRGPFGGSLKKEIFVINGYKIYEQKHAIQNDFSIGKYFISKEKFEEMKAFAVKPGDFIISCSGTIGKIAEIPDGANEGIINQALLKLSLDNNKIINEYFRYLFQSEYIQRHLTKVSRGVAIKNVPSVKELKTIKFPVPSLPEQKLIIQDIESKFSIIDKIERVVEDSLKKAEKLRKSILKSAFEGKLIKNE